MPGNSFGKHFVITTFGESHGKGLGVVIDGCPAGLPITEEEIQVALAKRSPGKKYTSPRQEKDLPEILSGVFEGMTTGTPICIFVRNTDAKSRVYESTQHLLRPGHANYTYLEKYGIFDYRGGGRASARETLCRVAAGAVAKKILLHYGITVDAHLVQIGSISTTECDLEYESELFCRDQNAEKKMKALLNTLIEAGDSTGGVIAFSAELPVGLGEPVYDKIEARLAAAMLSIPASKGFEMGCGFKAAEMKGSKHNDPFTNETATFLKKNDAGGTLGGISSGATLEGKVAFKPTSSIQKPQKTITQTGETATYIYPKGSRHDPCVAIRAVPIVEAMLSLVLVDLLLANRSAKL